MPDYKTIKYPMGINKNLDFNDTQETYRQSIFEELRTALNEVEKFRLNKDDPYKDLSLELYALTQTVKAALENVYVRDNWTGKIHTAFYGPEKVAKEAEEDNYEEDAAEELQNKSISDEIQKGEDLDQDEENEEPDYDDWEADYPIIRAKKDEDPNFGTLSHLLGRIDTAMAENSGRAMKDENFRRIVENANKLASAKNILLMEDAIFDAEWELHDFALLKKELGNFGQKFNKHVDTFKQSEFANQDYTKLDDIYNEELKKLDLLKAELDKKANELANFSKSDDRILKLTNDNAKYYEQLEQIGNEKTDLTVHSLKLNAINTGLNNQLKDIKNYLIDAADLSSLISSGEKELKETSELISKQNEELTRLKSIESGAIADMKLTQKDVDESVGLENTIEKLTRIEKNLGNQHVLTYISVLLNDKDKLSGAALSSALNRDQYALSKGMPKENLESLRGAREIIDFLAFGNNQAVRWISESVESTSKEPYKNLKAQFHKTLLSKIKERDEKAKEISAKLAKASKSKSAQSVSAEDYIKKIKEIRENRIKISELNNSLDDLNALKDARMLRNDSNTEKLGNLYSEKNYLPFAKKLKESIAKLRELGASEEKLKDAEHLITGRKGQVGAFSGLEKIVDKLREIGKDVEADINNKQADCDKRKGNIESSINANDNSIIELEKEKRDQVSKLSKEKNAFAAKLNRLHTIINNKKALLEEYNAYLDDVEQAEPEAEKLVSKFDSAVTGNILSDMFRLYKTMNDGRWRPWNSSEYENMVRPLCDLIHQNIPEKGDNLRTKTLNLDDCKISQDDLRERLSEMKTAAAEYIELKGEPNHFSTSQKYQRLSFARQLIELCKASEKQLDFAENYKQTVIAKPLYEYLNQAAVIKNIDQNPEAEEPVQEELKERRKQSFEKLVGKLLNKPAQAENKRESELIDAQRESVPVK